MGKRRNAFDALAVIGLIACVGILWFMKNYLIFDPVTNMWVLK